MPTSLSLIIPTIGRSSLKLVVNDALAQMRGGDSIVVVWDPINRNQVPDLGDTANQWRDRGVGIWFHQLADPAHDYGCTACDYGIGMANGDYVFFIGDDDRIPPGAFDTIRAGVSKAPDMPHLFAMQHTGRILANSLVCGEVSGQQIVVPRDMAKMPKMTAFNPGELAVSDWRFIQNVEKAWGKIVMHDGLIAILPRMNQGRML